MEKTDQFNEPFDDQDWLDIGADLRIKIRQEFSRLRKEKDLRIRELETMLEKAVEQRNLAYACSWDKDLGSMIADDDSELQAAAEAVRGK